jgi:putative polyketide hydroxylase
MPASEAEPQQPGDVLIVGGGLAGLSAAMFLGIHGIKATLVERHVSTSVQPRARGQVPVTMEALKVAGVDREVRDASVADRLHVVIAESLVGQEYQVILGDENPDFGMFSPAPWGLASQERVEPILARRATELGASLRFGTRLENLEERENDVRVTLRDEATGEARESLWRFVIAADGHRAEVRNRLGIGWHGAGDLGNITCIVFDADLTEALKGRRFALYHLRGAVPGATFVTTDTDGRYALHVGNNGPILSQSEAVETIRQALGLPSLEVSVVDIAPWTVALRIADRFVSDRVALIGDAAKLMPPTGGFGGNAAILDAYSLAWKLAAILDGNAGMSLLQTHDDERRPFAELVAAQQLTQMALRTGAGTGAAASPGAPPIDPAAVLFGFRFSQGAFVAEVAHDEGLDDPLAPSGRPGTRAAYVTLPGGDDHTSKASAQNTIDLFGREFVLLSGNEASLSAVDDVRTASGVAIRTQIMQKTVGPAGGRLTWPTAFGVTEGGAVLVRPDGVIAWRTEGVVGGGELTKALDETLRRR